MYLHWMEIKILFFVSFILKGMITDMKLAWSSSLNISKGFHGSWWLVELYRRFSAEEKIIKMPSESLTKPGNTNKDSITI